VVITSSIWSRAVLSPSRMWALSWALVSSNWVRRRTTLARCLICLLQYVLQAKHPWLDAVDQRHHIKVEGGLERREFVELVEQLLGVRIFLEVNDDPDFAAGRLNRVGR